MKPELFSPSVLQAHSLGAHTDVAISNPTNNQVLQYNATSQKFENSLLVPPEIGAGTDGQFIGTVAGAAAWTDLPALDPDLTALAGITVARGTIPVGNSSPAWSGLAKGSAYLPLRMDSSGNDPGYGTLQPQGGGTGITSYTAGDILYCSATNTLSKLAKGLDGQFLSLASGVPVWVDAPEGGVGMGLEYVTTLFGQPVESTNAETLYTVGTAPSLPAGDYLLKFTAMIGSDAYKIRVAYRVNAGADIQNYAGTYYPNRPFAYAVTITLSEGDSIVLRAACSSYGYGAFATLEIWRVV